MKYIDIITRLRPSTPHSPSPLACHRRIELITSSTHSFGFHCEHISQRYKGFVSPPVNSTIHDRSREDEDPASREPVVTRCTSGFLNLAQPNDGMERRVTVLIAWNGLFTWDSRFGDRLKGTAWVGIFLTTCNVFLLFFRDWAMKTRGLYGRCHGLGVHDVLFVIQSSDGGGILFFERCRRIW